MILETVFARYFPKEYRHVSKAMNFIEIADCAIREAIQRHPEAADRLNECFMLLRPPSMMQPLFYRAHCDQLLERVACGGDVAACTDAELLVALADTSLKAPMNTEGASLYAYLFLHCAAEIDPPLRTQLEQMARMNLNVGGNRKLADDIAHRNSFRQRRAPIEVKHEPNDS